MKCLSAFASLCVVLSAAAGAVSAATIVFDENAIPNNPVNGFGSFAFSDFSTPGAVTTTATSIVLDIVDSNSSNGVFGGVGVDYVIEDPPASGAFVPQDFDPNLAEWQLRVKILPGNEATGINATMVDDDGAGTADDHQFNFDLSGVPNDGQFHLLTTGFGSPGFTQPASGFAAGNGTVDPGLRQIQLQSQFGSTGRLNVEVDFLRISIVPEPSSLLLTVLTALVALTRRR